MAARSVPFQNVSGRKRIHRRFDSKHTTSIKLIVGVIAMLFFLKQSATMTTNLTPSTSVQFSRKNAENERYRAPISSAASTYKKEKQRTGSKAVVAYVISITTCPVYPYKNISSTPLDQTDSTGQFSVFDGPAILGHSIHRSSIRFNATISKYDYRLYAFVHPDSNDCAENLSKLGYEILIRDTPIDVHRIHNEQYKEDIESGGCCGSKEFMKLWAYTLVDHPIVVHLDTDVFLSKPFDNLFDAMLVDDATNMTLPTMFNKPLPKTIDFFFTRDYKQRSRITKDPSKYGVQGGFFVIRPDVKLFQELVHTIQEGNYTKRDGWAGQQYGGYWGSSQIQGFLSYFYGSVRPLIAVELNRCLYNTMTDDNPMYQGMCRTGEGECEDCRLTPVSEVVSFHLTSCWKPWQCPKIKEPHPASCNDAHLAWFKLRQSLEIGWGIEVPTEGWWFERTLGYCRRPVGAKKRIYVPLQFKSELIPLS